MKKRLIIFAVFFVLLILTPILSSLAFNYLLKPATKSEEEQIFVITPGQPVKDIAQNLQEKKLIRSALAFRLLVSQMGISRNLQAGDFRLSPNMSSREVAEELTHGAIDIWITLPEGLRKEEQAQRIEEKLKIKQNDTYRFDKKEYIQKAEEGYMFPDTYLIPKDATASDIASRLRQTFNQKAGAILEKGQDNNLSPVEVLTLASLIEREAKTQEERPIIAGIIMNRLNIGMKLDIDATVRYSKGFDAASGSWWSAITQEDYKSVKSPFNTYLNAGLPPAPICSPGLESIQAAASPAKTDYLYYLHDSEGKIHFAKTVEEHNQNINKYLF